MVKLVTEVPAQSSSSHAYSVGLDLIRIISALLVVLMHLRAALYVDWSFIEHKSIVSRAFYFLTSLGAEAVVAFFVLSGFLVGGSLLRARRLCWRRYLSTRLVRLWIVLLPALLLAAFLLVFTPVEYLSGQLRSAWASGPVPGDQSCSLSTWFGNLFFLQKIAVPVFCNDGPLWSLAYEFWYYLLFPLFLVGIRDRRFLLLLPAFALCLILGQPVLEGFVYWLLGVAVAACAGAEPFLSLSSRTRVAIQCLGFSLLPLSIFLGKISLSPPMDSSFLSRLPLAIAIALLVFGMAPISIPQNTLRVGFLGSHFRRFSESTFSLYVLHFPLICVLVPRWVSAQYTSLSQDSVLLFGGLLILCLSLSVVFASLT